MPGFAAWPAPSRPRGDIRLLGGGGGCGLPAPAPLLRALPPPDPAEPFPLRGRLPIPGNPSIHPSVPPSRPGHPPGAPPRCIPGALAERGAGDAAVLPMVSRRRSPPHHVAAAAAPERMFEGCRRARSLWGGVRLEVAGESSPVVLHSFTQLDPDLPPLEVSAGEGGGWGASLLRGVWGAQPAAQRAPERRPSLFWRSPPRWRAGYSRPDVW